MIIKLIAETTNHIPEYIALMNIKEKCIYYHIRAKAVVDALFDFIGLFELQTGCRDGMANWRAIYQVLACR
jgi:hypothetical protein